MMQRRTLIAGLAITTLGLPAPSAMAWDLVSPEEERQEDVITPPTIEVIRPDPAKPISGPVTIQLAFRTQPSASIVPSTFEATYGFLGLDITARLLQHATLTPQGITAEDVSIPSGRHSITLSIADTLGRIAKRTFQVTVL
jgi:hypothetical protein